ncbi:MAG: hypothetical protein AB1589_09505 [Cyanobacteriota bacterium]
MYFHARIWNYSKYSCDRSRTRQVNPHIQIFQVSGVTGAGLGSWYALLPSQFHKLQPSPAGSLL